MRIRFTILLSIITGWMSYAQSPDLKIEGHNVVLHLERSMPRADQEGLLKKVGMTGLSLDTLWKFGSIGQWLKAGWKLSKTNTGFKVYKSVTDLSGDLKTNKAIFNYKSNLATTISSQVQASFGSNSIRNASVSTTKAGTRFVLKGYTS